MKRRMLQWVIDVAFAVALAAAGVVEIWLPLPSVVGTGNPVVSTIVAVILCLALSVRRALPLATALIVLLAWPLAFSIQPILVLFWGQLVPIVIATYSVARHGSRRDSVIGGAAAAACLLFFDFGVAVLQEPGEIFFHWLVVVLAWVVGTLVNRAERRAVDAHRRAVDIEAESRTRMLGAIADERSRIARELHDVVAHAVSVMVVQAGAAEQVVDDDPAFARTALASIRSTGADALGEMRRVVAMLRDDSEGPLHPQPGLDGLAALAAEARAAGLEVSLSIEGKPHLLPAGLELAAFRIVQEALTNVRRHAGASAAEVTIDYTDAVVVVQVRDDGSGGHAHTEGHGLIGMRERAALYGGRLDTVPSVGRGFTVRAELPVASS
ncbi:MAG TPA: sensor histidine kinase [Terrimesophilobacter sp.]|nr:sensor histidine kinase [Terrimesophilobacter sp.]